MLAAWFYAALFTLFLLLTLNSFRPVRNNRLLFVPSFFASWLTNELAPFYLASMVAITAGFVVVGDVLDHPAGWVGLALMVLTWGLLYVIHRGGVSTGPAIAAALDGYGVDHDPARPSRHAVRKIPNVEYRRAAGRRLRLDVVLPADATPQDRRPALVQIHGGGWIIGDKREQGRPLLRRMASNGWVCFNVNYRLSPAATWPDHLVDCKAAVAWVRAHAHEYGVDPDFVAVTGGSAGGHLATLVALTADDHSLQPGFEDADCSVQAAVPIYGVYDFTNRLHSYGVEMRHWILEPIVMKRFYDDEPDAFAAASPIDRVHAGAPPFLVIHGDRDTLAPVEDARYFVERLAEASRAPVFYAELPGAQHAFEIFSSPRARRALDGVQRFLFETHHRHSTPTEQPEPDVVTPAGVGPNAGWA